MFFMQTTKRSNGAKDWLIRKKKEKKKKKKKKKKKRQKGDQTSDACLLMSCHDDVRHEISCDQMRRITIN